MVAGAGAGPRAADVRVRGVGGAALGGGGDVAGIHGRARRALPRRRALVPPDSLSLSLSLSLYIYIYI